MKMTFRTKALVVTSIFILIYLVLQSLDFSRITHINQNILKAFLVTFIFFIGLYWSLGFSIRGARFFTILGYSSFVIFIQSLFVELIVFQNLGRISERTLSLLFMVAFWFVVYFLILTANILNISSLTRIPLAQAAKAVNFLYTQFTAYFSFLLISKFGVGEGLKIVFFLFVIFFLTLCNFWFKKESMRQLWGETIGVVLCLFVWYIALRLWPLSAEVLSLSYSIVFYSMVGLGLEERETTSTFIRFEYLFLLVFIFILILKLASWGINGTLI